MSDIFETMDSDGQFDELMDDAAAISRHARDVAKNLLELAHVYRDRAEKITHLAATLLIEAQEAASETADLIAMQFGDLAEPDNE